MIVRNMIGMDENENLRDDNRYCAVEDEGFGRRILISQRDIEESELIFRESPILVSPSGFSWAPRGPSGYVDVSTVSNESSAVVVSPKFTPICLGCYKKVTTKYRCSKCGWPLCNYECETSEDHASYECLVFAENPVSPITNFSEYARIKVLRCLLLKEKKPYLWKELMKLESHTEARKENVAAVTSLIAMYKFIQHECHLTSFDFQTINHIVGICDSNAHWMKPQSYAVPPTFHEWNVSIIFHQASLILQDCRPNTYHVIEKDSAGTCTISVYAATNIPKGIALTSSRVSPVLSTFERQCAGISENSYIPCSCGRCKDPSELGSFYSSLKCPSCPKGYLMPKNSLSPNSPWICYFHDYPNECPPIKGSDIIGFLQNVKADIAQAQSVKALEDLILKYREKLLHKNHYLVVQIQIRLIEKISEALKAMADTVAPAEKMKYGRRMVELCRSCITVFNIIYPGVNSFRGKLLYYLQDGLLNICIGKMNECEGSKDLEIVRKSSKKMFAEILELIKEAKAALINQPIGSFERSLTKEMSVESPRIKPLMLFFGFTN